jgi:hypothetical protein
MLCPHCNFEIPRECRTDVSHAERSSDGANPHYSFGALYACPTCHEEFRWNPNERPGRRIQRSGPSQGKWSQPRSDESFREWFWRMTT